jgi:hypothetical protein
MIKTEKIQSKREKLQVFPFINPPQYCTQPELTTSALEMAKSNWPVKAGCCGACHGDIWL